jgi:hypothetical protein
VGVVVVYHLQNDTEDTLPTPPLNTLTNTNNSNSSSNNKHKHTKNDVTKYTQSLPEDTTSTVLCGTDKQKTVTQYISQEEKQEILKSRQKIGFPHNTVYVNQLSRTTIIQQVDTVTVKSVSQ